MTRITCDYAYANGTVCPINASAGKPLCTRHGTSGVRRRKGKEMKVADHLRNTWAPGLSMTK
eukprot:9506-Eustigmatos_ZCMA.PRE.1